MRTNTGKTGHVIRATAECGRRRHPIRTGTVCVAVVNISIIPVQKNLVVD